MTDKSVKNMMPLVEYALFVLSSVPSFSECEHLWTVLVDVLPGSFKGCVLIVGTQGRGQAVQQSSVGVQQLSCEGQLGSQHVIQCHHVGRVSSQHCTEYWR